MNSESAGDEERDNVDLMDDDDAGIDNVFYLSQDLWKLIPIQYFDNFHLFLFQIKTDRHVVYNHLFSTPIIIFRHNIPKN